ncbi:hypothetical protein [Rhodococcus qingshengii]|uniref:hypothetical protein n=1 Tax=Rhodococcus qingshengii TaxID=334542 RepID=UPI001BE8C6E4|nr:hypothetical protein [Rhodococcus qingshengii]MBT2275341.1 hypothetical protein [Rhodococcus qingshengii]
MREHTEPENFESEYYAGLEIDETEGGNHTKVVVGGRRTVLARHSEIPELTAKAIRRQLGMTEVRKGKK